MISILNWVGYVSTILFLLTLASGIFAWIKGILPALIRLGNGLAKRKVAIFAKGDHLRSLEGLLLDSNLFNKKNVIDVASESDFGRAEQATLFLVFWKDWEDKLAEILKTKKDSTALIVYAPQDLGSIPPEKMQELNSKRNVIVVNFRGRLLNDIIMSFVTISYE